MHNDRFTIPLFAAMLWNFDVDAFMQQTVDGPLETEYKLIPVGEYRAMIDDFTSEAIEVLSGEKDGKPWQMTKFTCPFVLDAPQVAVELNRTKVIATKQVILDIDQSTGRIATGPNRNVELGRIRKAVGQETTQNWTLPMLRNSGPCMVKIVHRSGVRRDGSPWERAEVDRVAPIVGS